jgi:hypothetical protein
MAMSTFVICLDNQANPESLIIGKVYLALPDAEAEKAGLLRVLDESFGETGSEAGYLYPMKMFAAVTLPEEARKVIEQVYS